MPTSRLLIMIYPPMRLHALCRGAQVPISVRNACKAMNDRDTRHRRLFWIGILYALWIYQIQCFDEIDLCSASYWW